MNEEAVLYTHTKVFNRALKAQDFDSLRKLYSEDCMLVRPDGSVLSKEQVLRDLNAGGLIFYSIELTDARVASMGRQHLSPERAGRLRRERINGRQLTSVSS